jgi:spermidine synthase
LGLALFVSERGRTLTAVAGVAALALAVTFSSSPGRDRYYGFRSFARQQILAFHEGPDSTVSVVEVPSGTRMLSIDGFVAAADDPINNFYMEWMGRLPAILSSDPRNALVICFGTGRTANSVRREGVGHLDIVELNASVFEMAGFFRINEGVLDDPVTNPIVMDGRAWLRRTEQQYDLITLEPMPPNFAGVNALYSREFYESVAARLEPGGVAAQWLPFHLVDVAHATAIAATFYSVFPDSIVWVSPTDGNGILLGRVAGSPRPLGEAWPGLARGVERPLDERDVRRAVRLSGETMSNYASLGRIITDDNQLLSHSQLRNGYQGTWANRVGRENARLLEKIAGEPAFKVDPRELRRLY